MLFLIRQSYTFRQRPTPAVFEGVTARRRGLSNEWKHRMHAPLLKFLRLGKYFLERNGNEPSFHEAVDSAEGSQGWLRTARQALSR